MLNESLVLRLRDTQSENAKLREALQTYSELGGG